MTDHIDHAARALQLSQSEYSDPLTDTAVAIQTEALVHATLALVEQQRVANFLAFAADPEVPETARLVAAAHAWSLLGITDDKETNE